jgi:phage terminase large subunit GpA-like protein
LSGLNFEDRALLASWHDDIADLIESKINMMLPTEWATKKRILPTGLTSLPGPFRWETTPYLKEIIDCFAPGSGVHSVAIMKGAQLGFSVGVLENLIGWIIDCEPGPTLFVSADKEMAESVVETRVDRMIESAGIGGKIFAQVEKKHNKKTGDTKEKKEFPGGFLLPVGPNVGGKLRSYSIRFVLFDEVDAFPQETGREGDPLKLAERRTDAFSRTRKLLYISTPTTEEESWIKILYENGDQSRFFVPCKHCGEFQLIEWRGIKWDTDDHGRLVWESVRYECEKCGGAWHDEDKSFFLTRGEWRPTVKPVEPGRRSFHLSSLYSPIGFRPWGSIVQEWLQCKDDVTRLRVFLNTVLGEVWQDRGEAPRYEKIMLRREEWKNGSPDDDGKIQLVTLGADVQKDRIECEVIGWGKGFENWSLAYNVFPGDTSELSSPAWRGLYDLLTGGVSGLPILMSLIDAGYNTGTVYQFCEQFAGGVMPSMGESSQGWGKKYFTIRPVAGYAVKRVDIQTGLFKAEIYGALQKGPTSEGDFPAGYCHFPEEYGENYFKMLTAEERVREKNKAGIMTTKWKQVRERNEALDCRVYGFAALHVLASLAAADLGIDGIPWDKIWELTKTR